jgi:glycerate kinase
MVIVTGRMQEDRPMPTLLALPDKFRGTATAAEVGAAMAAGACDAGWDCVVLPISDGGEGLLECFGGANRTTEVTGPLGGPVPAGWRHDGTRAVIEMAAASGLALVAAHNDPLAATTRGTGELIAAALDAGVQSIIVGVGGSASTDGGLGAVEVLAARRPLPGVTVAADVVTHFVDAARLFGPQKGADPAAVAVLADRLEQLGQSYRDRFGVDVTDQPGSGAAGGLGGGLLALGATIRPGFDVVAEFLDLEPQIAAADFVLTGEGRLDATSLLGKAPVAVTRLSQRAGTPVALLVGEVAADVAPPAALVSLVDRIGREAALADPLPAVRAITAELLRSRAG